MSKQYYLSGFMDEGEHLYALGCNGIEAIEHVLDICSWTNCADEATPLASVKVAEEFIEWSRKRRHWIVNPRVVIRERK